MAEEISRSRSDGQGSGGFAWMRVQEPGSLDPAARRLAKSGGPGERLPRRHTLMQDKDI